MRLRIIMKVKAVIPLIRKGPTVREKLHQGSLLLLLGLMGCGGSNDESSSQTQSQQLVFTTAEEGEALSGGATTVFNSTREAYSKPPSNMITSRRGDFFVGNDFFEDPWVAAPATTTARDGLGPLFNVSACQSCHIKDGRGHAPINSEDNADSLLIRLSRPARTNEELNALNSGEVGNLGDDSYGGQLQDRSVQGVPAEGNVTVTYTDRIMTFDDGHEVVLREPKFEILDLNYGPLGSDTVLSMRVAPPMIGLGLLEFIDEADILAQADELDSDNDGISGRVNRVWDLQRGAINIGRFGWKAGQPTLLQQSAGAFNGDIGITSNLFPVEGCTDSQAECLDAPEGITGNETHEVTDEILGFVEFYSQNLAVPARRNVNDATVLEGKSLFYNSGCTACHTPSYTTALLGDENIELSEQSIRPFTDLLLHDMGEDLADRTLTGEAASDQPVEFLATAREWRTPPLWGVGLAQVVDANATFLHDGRARTLMEAVLWHGGEAAASRDKVLTFDEQERSALIAFLESL